MCQTSKCETKPYDSIRIKPPECKQPIGPGKWATRGGTSVELKKICSAGYAYLSLGCIDSVSGKSVRDLGDFFSELATQMGC
jgi:hypothetical protein